MPHMCADKSCAGGTDHCCERNCDTKGGERDCGVIGRIINAVRNSRPFRMEKNVGATHSPSQKLSIDTFFLVFGVCCTAYFLHEFCYKSNHSEIRRPLLSWCNTSKIFIVRQFLFLHDLILLTTDMIPFSEGKFFQSESISSLEVQVIWWKGINIYCIFIIYLLKECFFRLKITVKF